MGFVKDGDLSPRERRFLRIDQVEVAGALTARPRPTVVSLIDESALAAVDDRVCRKNSTRRGRSYRREQSAALRGSGGRIERPIVDAADLADGIPFLLRRERRGIALRLDSPRLSLSEPLRAAFGRSMARQSGLAGEESTWLWPRSSDGVADLVRFLAATGLQAARQAIPAWLSMRHLEEAIGSVAFYREWPEAVARAAETSGLLPYQKDGVLRLGSIVQEAWERGEQNPSALLADEMGLGKTVQALMMIRAALLAAQRAEIPPLALVVCPAWLRRNWVREARRWLPPTVDVKALESGNDIGDSQSFASLLDSGLLAQDGMVLIISYELATQLRHSVLTPRIDHRLAILVLDEAHALKNPKSQRTQAILGHGLRQPGFAADVTIFITGTPILNRPIELWPLLQRLARRPFGPGETALGSNWRHYAVRYCSGRQIEVARGRLVWWVGGSSNVEELGAHLSRVMVRREKVSVLSQLPPKRRQVLVLDSSEIGEEVRRIASVIEEAKAEADSYGVRDWAAAKAFLLSRLTQARAELAVAKVPLVVRLCEDILGSSDQRKVVIFVCHREPARRLAEALRSQGAVVATGDISPSERVRRADMFQSDPRVRVFLATYAAAGTGVTLTAASHVIMAEPDWVPAVMLQAEDRLHRLGQNAQSVHAIYPVIEGTLDEEVVEKAVEKLDALRRVFPGESGRHVELGDSGTDIGGSVFDSIWRDFMMARARASIAGRGIGTVLPAMSD